MLRRILMILFFSLTTFSAHGQGMDFSVQKPFGQKGVQLSLAVQYDKHAEEAMCYRLTENMFGNATHPGGGGHLNERNHGTGFSCYQEPYPLFNREMFGLNVGLQQTHFYFANGLLNSQYGSTFAFGHGEGLRLNVGSFGLLRSVNFGAGIAFTAFSYEQRLKTKRGIVFMPFDPMPYIEGGVELPRNTYLAVKQLYLPMGIHLRYVEMGIKLQFNM